MQNDTGVSFLTDEIRDAIEEALAMRAGSRREARIVIARLESERQRLLATNNETVIRAVDLFTLLWMKQNRGFVTNVEFERALRRTESHEPRVRARRLFDLGALQRVARFIKTYRRSPAGLTNPFARHPKFRPLVEIEVLQQLPDTLLRSGLRPLDRLVVHIGSEIYDGAVAFMSMDLPPVTSGKLAPTVVFLARLLESEEEGGLPLHFRRVRIRLRDDDAKGIELPAGEVRVEAVVFNREDLLAALPEN